MKKKYGGFPWEIRTKDSKNFPVIFDFDEASGRMISGARAYVSGDN